MSNHNSLPLFGIIKPRYKFKADLMFKITCLDYTRSDNLNKVSFSIQFVHNYIIIITKFFFLDVQSKNKNDFTPNKFIQKIYSKKKIYIKTFSRFAKAG